MKEVIKEVLGMPYYRNHQAVSGKAHNTASHEEAVARVLTSKGYREHTIKLKESKKTRDRWLNKDYDEQYCKMKEDTFISQPCGKNDSPDFIVKDDKGRLFFLESKSAKKGTPMYNSGVPKGKYIYILTSGKHNATTAYLGGDCLPEKAKILIEKHISQAREADSELEKELSKLTEYGISYYTRPMIQHKGKQEKTDYFQNKNRVVNEQNVLKFIEQETL